jgi:hypothetical protein
MRVEIMKFALAVILGAFVVGLAGCAGSGGNHSSRPLGVDADYRSNPRNTVRLITGSRKAIDRVGLHHNARFLSPTRMAILTWGSFTCPAVPNRLVVETPDMIRIHLTGGSWHGKLPVAHPPTGGACTADHSSAVIVIAIDPKRINVHHRLTIRLYYYNLKKPEIRTAPPL